MRGGPIGMPLLLLLILLLLRSAAIGQQSASSFGDLVARAQAAREQNQTSIALDLYRQAVELNPKWPDGWWFLGLLQYGTDAYAGARDAFTHYVDLTPTAAPAIALRGLCEFELGDHAQALADLQRGLSMGAANQPRNAQILYFHEAQLLTEAGRFEEALGVYTTMARQFKPNPELLVAMGLGGLRKPLLAAQLPPDQRDLYLAAGGAAYQFMAGHDFEAQSEFQSLFQRFPAAANTHLLYGYLLFAKDLDQAVTQFQQELAVTPANGTAHALLAWASLLADDPVEALPNARKAAEEEPGVATAQLVLGRSLVETGDVQGGMPHLEKALQIEPDNLETHLALVKAYSKAGRTQEAQRERLECLQRASREAPQVAQP